MHLQLDSHSTILYNEKKGEIKQNNAPETNITWILMEIVIDNIGILCIVF